MKLTDKIDITNEDNMALMARYPDGYFDLAFIDPEYGIKAARPTDKPNSVKQSNGTILYTPKNKYTHKDWDDKPADAVFGNEIKRVSKNQIVWGANYFDWIVERSFKPPRRMDFNKFIIDNPKGWILWDKVNGNSDQLDCELAWCSFDIDSIIIPYMWAGMMQGSMKDGKIMEGNKKKNEKRTHVTQKPLRIYELIYNLLSDLNYFQVWYTDYPLLNFKILDTGIGSGSHGDACHNLGFELTACELDKEYYEAAVKRIKTHVSQKRLF